MVSFPIASGLGLSANATVSLPLPSVIRVARARVNGVLATAEPDRAIRSSGYRVVAVAGDNRAVISDRDRIGLVAHRHMAVCAGRNIGCSIEVLDRIARTSKDNVVAGSKNDRVI